MSAMDRFRIDFIQDIIEVNETDHTFHAKLSLDPRRYEWKMVGGEECLYDKLNDEYIPKSFYEDAVKQIVGAPIYFQPRLIENPDEYIIKRVSNIRAEFNDSFPKPTFKDKSEEFLEELEVNELGFVILSLDIVNSTILSTTLSSDKYSKLISVLLFEFSSIIPLFHGHILKYTGDGIIAYFPEPSFILKNDLAID